MIVTNVSRCELTSLKVLNSFVFMSKSNYFISINLINRRYNYLVNIPRAHHANRPPMLDKYTNINGMPISAYTIVAILPKAVFGVMFPYPENKNIYNVLLKSNMLMFYK